MSIDEILTLTDFNHWATKMAGPSYDKLNVTWSSLYKLIQSYYNVTKIAYMKNNQTYFDKRYNNLISYELNSIHVSLAHNT